MEENKETERSEEKEEEEGRWNDTILEGRRLILRHVQFER